MSFENYCGPEDIIPDNTAEIVVAGEDQVEQIPVAEKIVEEFREYELQGENGLEKVKLFTIVEVNADGSENIGLGLDIAQAERMLKGGEGLKTVVEKTAAGDGLGRDETMVKCDNGMYFFQQKKEMFDNFGKEDIPAAEMILNPEMMRAIFEGNQNRVAKIDLGEIQLSMDSEKKLVAHLMGGENIRYKIYQIAGLATMLNKPICVGHRGKVVEINPGGNPAEIIKEIYE